MWSLAVVFEIFCARRNLGMLCHESICDSGIGQVQVWWRYRTRQRLRWRDVDAGRRYRDRQCRTFVCSTPLWSHCNSRYGQWEQHVPPSREAKAGESKGCLPSFGGVVESSPAGRSVLGAGVESEEVVAASTQDAQVLPVEQLSFAAQASELLVFSQFAMQGNKLSENPARKARATS